MPVSIVDVSAFTSPVTAPINFETYDAVHVLDMGQALSNRTRYLYNMLLAGVGSRALPATDIATKEMNEDASKNHSLLDGMFFSEVDVTVSIEGLKARSYNNRQTTMDVIATDASITLLDCAARSYPSITGSAGDFLALIVVGGTTRAWRYNGTWTQMTDPISAVTSVAANQSNGRIVVAGNGVNFSDNSGATWTNGTSGVDGRVRYYPSANLWVCYGAELWTSTDGAVWTDRGALIPAGVTNIVGIEHVPEASRWILSGSIAGPTQKFMTSTTGPDVGGWVDATVAPTVAGSGGWPIAAGAGVALAIRQENVWASYDGGINWSFVGISPGTGEILFDKLSRRFVLRRTAGRGVIASVPLV